MNTMTRRTLLLVASATLFVGCAGAGPNIKADAPLGKPAEASIVAGYVNTFAGTMISDVTLMTSAGPIEAKGNGGYFAFANVPPGPVKLVKMSVTDGAPMLSITRHFEGGKVRVNDDAPYALENGGTIETIAGTAKGGFLWLGEFDLSQGSGRRGAKEGTYPITVSAKADPDRRATAVKKLRTTLKGTEWESAIE